MRDKIIFLVASILLIFVGCSNGKEVDYAKLSESLGPKKVVEKHFEYYDDKNSEGIISTLTERYNSSNTDFGLNNLKSKKIISIEEDNSSNIREDYLTSDRGAINGVTQENLKIFKVEYDVQYKGLIAGPQDSGRHTWFYYVIREDASSPWLIDGMGV